VGTFFGVFLLLVMFFSAYLIITRLPLLKSKNELDSILSREASFMFNNLLLLGAAFAVLWGTTFPMISELVRGQKITVGAPFFNQVMTPIGLLLLLLTGICPLIAWRKASWVNTRRNFLTPFAITFTGAVAIWFSGIHDFLPLVSFTICVFVASTIGMEIIRGVRARAAGGKENAISAFINLFWRNKRRYGGYVVHIGVILIFVGFTGSMYNLEKEATLMPGEKMEIGDYSLTYIKSDFTRPKQTLEKVIATVLVEKDGEKLGYALPERNVHYTKDVRGNMSPQPTSEVAIRTTYKEDLYLIFASVNESGSATFKAHVNPLVKWLWLGGVVIGLGGILAMWPDKREHKRFMARHTAAGAKA
jgi:cytochrome c-type biogenesis protein CcmF